MKLPEPATLVDTPPSAPEERGFGPLPATSENPPEIKIKTGQNSQGMTEMPGEFSNSTTGDYGDYMITACTNGNQIFLWANKEQSNKFCPKYLSQSFAIMPHEDRMSTFIFRLFLFMKPAAKTTIPHRPVPRDVSGLFRGHANRLDRL
jgi:hypothetical protein